MAIMEFLVIFFVSAMLVLICPYTKVEESFNMQAIHDILYEGKNVHNYDHLEFPGVVPRTFIGPIFISFLSYPFIKLLQYNSTNKFITQYIVRIILGLIVSTCFAIFCGVIRNKYGKLVSRFLTLVTLSQFHFMFYSSRPLPNTLALSLVLLAYSSWLLQKQMSFIWFSGAAIVIFRSELAIVFGLILILELVSGRLKLRTFLLHVVPAGITLLGASVLIDSYFWRRWVWPEGEVLWYNTILNKSSNWGTSPIWWYFTSALPRSLLLSIFFIPLGSYYDRRMLTLIVPAIGYIALYSLLPHKELRFIIYAIPLLNTISSVGHAYMKYKKLIDFYNSWRNRTKISSIFPFLSLLSLLLSWLMSLLFIYISYHNYPGGHAFHTLHKLIQTNDSVSVHIGVEPAMTGVTRFGQLNELWNYSKAEDLSNNDLMQFDYIIVSASSNYKEDFNSTHQLIHSEQGFTRLAIALGKFPPLRIVIEDKIYILKKAKI